MIINQIRSNQQLEKHDLHAQSLTTINETEIAAINETMQQHTIDYDEYTSHQLEIKPDFSKLKFSLTPFLDDPNNQAVTT